MPNNIEPITQEALKSTIRDFLDAHRKAIFAILDEQGLPTTSLMLYVIDDGLNVFFGTCKSFKKYKNIIEKPVVSLSVIEESIDPLRVVDIRGDVVEISEDMIEETHAFFKKKNSSKYYVENAEDFVMFKLTPHFIRYLDAESGRLSTIDLDLD